MNCPNVLQIQADELLSRSPSHSGWGTPVQEFFMIKHCRPTITVHITVNIASSRQGQAVISSQNTMSKFLTEVPPHGQKYLPKLAVPVQRSSCFDSNHYYFLHNKIIGTNVASHVVSSEPALSSKNLFAGVASACGWCLCTNRKKKRKESYRLH